MLMLMLSFPEMLPLQLIQINAAGDAVFAGDDAAAIDGAIYAAAADDNVGTEPILPSQTNPRDESIKQQVLPVMRWFWAAEVME